MPTPSSATPYATLLLAMWLLLVQGCGYTPDRTVERAAIRDALAALDRGDHAAAGRIYQRAADQYTDPGDYDVKGELLSSAALWLAWSGDDAAALRALDECASLRRTITSQFVVQACEEEKHQLRTRTGLYANVPRRAAAAPGSAVGSAVAAGSGTAAAGAAQVAGSGGSSSSSGGCPSSLAHIEPRLPLCTANANLMELRRMVLATDVSFRADRAQGLSYQQIAITASQAAIQFEQAMKQDEQAMLQASANAGLARARLAALRETPPRCDAGPAGSFGMGENAYQAYAASYMAAVANRAVAAVAACLGRNPGR